MKAIILAAVAAVTLGVGVASAQGLPVSAYPQAYGSVRLGENSNTQSLNAPAPQSVQRETDRAAAPRITEHNVTEPAYNADGG
jgi:hypothetical protein